MLNISQWVVQDDENRMLREAVHTVLHAIALNADLNSSLSMKGGMLLALQYGSVRFTKDVDFSTTETAEEFDQETFKKRFNIALQRAATELSYDLDCRVQSAKRKPPAPGHSWPTVKIGVGHAYRGTRAHERLMRNSASDVLRVDLSLNEELGGPDTLYVDDDHSIHAYSFAEIVAEKLRAILQQVHRGGQPERGRPQDVYDIDFLLRQHPRAYQTAEQEEVLRLLLNKAHARGMDPERNSMRDAEVRKLAERRYKSDLSKLLPAEPPPFEDLYERVQKYYEGLPW